MKKWIISVTCVLSTVAVPAATPDTAESVEDSLDQARAMLDEAAGKFAEQVVGYVEEFDFEKEFERPFLGIMIHSKDGEGVRVANVTPGSGAEDAGILAKDLIVRVNDVDLTGSQTPIILLHEALDEIEKGVTVEVELLRDGETMTVGVVPEVGIKARIMRLHPGGAAHPGIDLTRAVNFWPGWSERRQEQAFGFKLIDVGETLGAYFGVDGGVLVLTAEEDSNLLPGDIVQRVGEDDIADADAAYLALAEAEESTKVVVRRNGKRKTLAVELIEGVKVRKLLEFSD